MINVTDEILSLSVERLQEILQAEGNPESWLRITAAPGSEGGASYLLDLEERASEEDPIVHVYANNVNIVIDRQSNLLLSGLDIDPAIRVVFDLKD